MKERFLQFLKEQGISKEYKRCFEKDPHSGSETFNEFLNHEPNADSYVGGAFIWERSSLGTERMKEIDRLWNLILTENKK